MGVHEANQEAGGDWTSPGKYFYRVHMEIPLGKGEAGEEVMNRVKELLKEAHGDAPPSERPEGRTAWDDLREILMHHLKPNPKANALLDAVLRDY